jgi:NAD(P)-dependent dehydrogenase (short-subunit alcohol dehydrogenase family)
MQSNTVKGLVELAALSQYNSSVITPGEFTLRRRQQMRFKDRVVVITGGEGALGRAASKKFLSEGAKLVIAWYSPEEWEEAKALLVDYKGQFTGMQVDATREEQVSKLMAHARDAYGSVDILLHTVGMYYSGKMIWETDVAVFERLVDVNLKSAFLCAKHAVKVMLEKGWGRIVLFPARLALEPQPKYGPYSVSKAGLITLMLALREELKETNITVNAVMPSVIDTWRTRKMPNAQPDKWADPSTIADLLCCVCSDESGVMSGSILKVFGNL